MSFSASRLTCFALISALEQDLRSNIRRFLIGEDHVATLSEGLAERAQQRRGRDTGAGARSATTLTALLPYLDFADGYEVLLRNRSNLPDDLSEQLTSIRANLERVSAVRNRVAHTRPMEIDDLSKVLDLARCLDKDDPDYWMETRTTLARLAADSSYVLGLSIDLPVEPVRGPMHNLPVPEFDETGFFGRRTQVNRIKKLIKGAYPVVSILGDGGIGKTSVALKVAYELLDDPNSQFDSIVWVTAKATALTANEIRRVNDAIEDSLGLFVKAAGELGGEGAEKDPIIEVLAYLESFRVLLILDNLETVLDRRLRDFLLDLPLGSKVILTSRIGAGVENPVQLEPLADDESHQLLRTVARIRDVAAIQALGHEQIRDLASRMGGHPLYIKWFVSGVQAGRRPEELLSDNSLFLDFCMSNVYEFLGSTAQSVLQCMQILPGEKRQAEIAFLAELDANAAQATLLQLLTTNFVHMESQTRVQGLETTYQLSEFARTYLDKQHPVSADNRRRIRERFGEMRDLGWRLQAENSASPYDPHTVNIRDSGDFSTARLLRDAISSLEVSDLDRATSLCREAQALSPMYSESWRVDALVQAAAMNMTGARVAYERALELDPGSATLNFLFGNFLSEERVDLGGAVLHLRRAAQFDKDNPHVLASLAWALLEAGHCEDAAATAEHVLRLGGAFEDSAFSVAVGLRAYCYLVMAANSSGHIYRAIEYIESAVELVDSSGRDHLEGEPRDRVVHLSDLAAEVRDQVDNDDEFRASRIALYLDKLSAKATDLARDGQERRMGKVQNIVSDKAYGFIRADRRGDYFFHLRDLANDVDWNYLQEGALVAFTKNDASARGRRATDVRWLP